MGGMVGLERQKGFVFRSDQWGSDASKAASKRLQAEGIFEPSRPAIHKSSRSGFRALQRRGSTEGRIGVLKNRWHGGIPYAAKALTTVTLAWPGRFCPTIYGKSRRDLRKNMRKRQRRRHRDPRIRGASLG